VSSNFDAAVRSAAAGRPAWLLVKCTGTPPGGRPRKEPLVEIHRILDFFFEFIQQFAVMFLA